jgi:cell division protein FtsN
MVVGRGQGRQIAAAAFEEREARKTPAEKADNFKFNYFDQMTGDKADLTLKPAPEPPPPARENPVLTSANPGPARIAEPTPAPKQPPPAAKPAGSFLQVAATKNEKQAEAELKKVKSKGFEAKIVIGTKDNAKWYRVMVGPYKESEVSLAKKDLQAKGYKGAFVGK